MKILFYNIESHDKNYLLDKISKNIEPYFFEFPINENTKIIDKYANCDAVCVSVNSNLDRKILSKFENLKYIFLRSTGYSHVDIEYCKENNIEVFNVPLYGSRTVAEYVFGLILALARKIAFAKTSLINASINKEELTGCEISGKTLGLIGAGNIGKEIIKISSGFNLNILAYDIEKSIENIKYVDLNTLLSDSDIIVISCPLDNSTRKLINRDNISKLKPDSYIVNIARGEILDTEALYLALIDNKIKGAALDVIECEEALCSLYKNCSVHKYLKDECLKKFLFIKKLAKLHNVIITPHNAYNTYAARKRILDTTLDNINFAIKNINSGTKILF